jgi:hypothetical protein
MKMAVFWVVAPCSLVEVYRHFRGNALMMEAASTSKLLPGYTALQPRRQSSSILQSSCSFIADSNVRRSIKISFFFISLNVSRH